MAGTRIRRGWCSEERQQRRDVEDAVPYGGTSIGAEDRGYKASVPVCALGKLPLHRGGD